MSPTSVAIVAALIVGWCAASARLGRLDITAPMAFVAAGLVLGGALNLNITGGPLKFVAEITLVLLLFADASRIDISSLREDIGLPGRLLGIGLPLTLLVGTALTLWLFPGVGTWPAILAAACLAPTDAGLGAGIVSDTRVPSRVRRALNVESGLNDGIVAPLVTLAIAVVAEESEHGSSFVVHALREIGYGAAVGLAVGVVGGWLLAAATRHHWTEEGADALAAAALALGAYATALAVHGNGFVAAFLAGLAFGPFRRSLEPSSLQLTESAGALAATLVWFAFGAAMLRPALEALTWRLVLYAVLSLTVARMVPVAIALIGAQLDRNTTLFMGWFGPRGLASVIFALLAFDSLGTRAGPLVAVVSITVLVSVVAHGVSASPLIARYSKHVDAQPTDHPIQREVEVPRTRRALGVTRTPSRPAST